ncbi:MAG: DNA polymerase III subunit gamma/tau C-terminal domain-containing protein, partial [Gammaproteobacteria bacterium]
LGTIERTHVRALMEAVAAHNGAALLAAVAQLDERAPDYALVLDEMAAVLQRVAVAQAVPQAAGEFTDAETIKALAARMDATDVQVCYQIALLGRRDLMLAPAPRAGFEMTLLRMLAFQPGEPAPLPVDSAGGKSAAPRAPVQTASAPQTDAPRPVAQTAQAWKEPEWPKLMEALGLRGAGQQLAANCAYRRREGATLYLEINAAHQYMATDQLVGRLEEALSRYYGETLKVRIQAGEGALVTPAVLDEKRDAERLAAAQSAIAADPRVRELCETFGTQVNPELVKPAD